MAETTDAAPAPEAPAAEPTPEAPVAAEPAALVPDAAPQPITMIPEHAEVMAQAEADEIEYIEPHATPPPADPAKEVTPTPEAKLPESPVAQFIEEESRIAELVKALEAGDFNAAPTELSEGGYWIEDERQIDVPGSDPRCTP